MIEVRIRFRDAYGEGRIEKIEYVTRLQAILPVGSGVFMPSYKGDRFLFTADGYTWYEAEKCLAMFVVGEGEGYDFTQADIDALIENGWSYVPDSNLYRDNIFELLDDHLTVRVYHALKNSGLLKQFNYSLAVIREMSDARLLKIPNIGISAIAEIRAAIATYDKNNS